MMFTGIALGRRFYVGAETIEEATEKVRKAHELRWGRESADALPISDVHAWHNVAWQS